MRPSVEPSVAADADGNFVVVWRDYQGYPGPPVGPTSSRADALPPTARPAGLSSRSAASRPGTRTSGSRPSLRTQTATSSSCGAVMNMARRMVPSDPGPPLLASDGTPGGPQFQVRHHDRGCVRESEPSVASNADGDFVVVWRDYQWPGPPYGYLVQGRRFAVGRNVRRAPVPCWQQPLTIPGSPP